MDILIRKLHPSDTETYSSDLAHILIAAWRSGFRGILDNSVIEKYTNYPDVSAMFAQILESDIGTMYLARLDGQSAGLLYLLTEDNIARIEALLTIPETWGKGAGAALVEQALTFARVAGCTSISVWPFAENHRAQRFYEKHGFRPTGKERTGDTLELEYFRPLK